MHIMTFSGYLKHILNLTWNSFTSNDFKFAQNLKLVWLVGDNVISSLRSKLEWFPLLFIGKIQHSNQSILSVTKQSYALSFKGWYYESSYNSTFKVGDPICAIIQESPYLCL